MTRLERMEPGPELEKSTLDSASRDKGSTLGVDISNDGDLLLKVYNQPGRPTTSYRVQSQVLIRVSPYFASLLGSRRFKEGPAFQKKLASLQEHYDNPSACPRSDLPSIDITELGPVSINLKRRRDIFGKLLQILHYPNHEDARISLGLLANVAIVADQFDCLGPVATWGRQSQVSGGARETQSAVNAGTPERHRRMVLIGWLLKYPDWISQHSGQLVLMPSYVGLNSVREPESRVQQALWLDLPGNIEEEIQIRRQLILETIDSLLQHLIKLYTPLSLQDKVLQCKLGYESSPQCDLFQLGQAMRFLTQVGLGSFQTILQDEAGLIEDRNIMEVIMVLRQCPSYQINSHHSHCGIRSKLIPRLDRIQALASTESRICGDCWIGGDSSQRWNGESKDGVWRFNEAKASRLPDKSTRAPVNLAHSACSMKHREAQLLFTAHQRDWAGD